MNTPRRSIEDSNAKDKLTKTQLKRGLDKLTNQDVLQSVLKCF